MWEECSLSDVSYGHIVFLAWFSLSVCMPHSSQSFLLLSLVDAASQPGGMGCYCGKRKSPVIFSKLDIDCCVAIAVYNGPESHVI